MTPEERRIVWEDCRAEAHESYVKEIFKGVISPRDQVLDIACAYGRFSSWIVKLGGFWTGLDHSQEMADMWKAKYQLACWPIISPSCKGRFIVRNCFEDWPSAIDAFDVVFGCMIRTPLELTVEDFRNWFLPLVKQPGKLILFEAHETYIWQRYEKEQDDGSVRAVGDWMG